MEQSNAPATPARPGFLTTLCILSYIGSGLWALFSLIGIFASGWIMSMLGQKMAEVSTSPAATDAMAKLDSMGGNPAVNMSENVANANAAASGFAAMGAGVIIGIFVVSLLLACLSLFGVMKMWKLKKSGFWMYTIANIIVIGLGLYGGSYVGGVVGLAFIGMYAANLKHMS